MATRSKRSPIAVSARMGPNRVITSTAEIPGPPGFEIRVPIRSPEAGIRRTARFA